MKTLLALMAAALILPEAVLSVTPYQSDSYTQQGVSLTLIDPAGSIYQQGESVRFSFESTSDGYVLVFDIDSDGYVSLLYPRRANSIPAIVGGQRYDVPAQLDQELLISGKTGIEFVFAVSIKDRGMVNDQEVAFFLAEEGKPASARYRVTGDPFLAANRIASRLIRGIAYTRDESMAYTYFYVNDAVDFPRYLCGDCESQKNDANAAVQWAPTAAFEQEAHLSYPLASAFARTEAVAENPVKSETSTTYVYNYYNRYPYYPYYSYYPYYPGYWGSGFYFSIGWNWGYCGVGWGWGYPYYPVYGWGYGCYPYAAPYYRSYPGCYYGVPAVYTPAIRPHRYKSATTTALRFTPKFVSATQYRTKTASVQRTDKLSIRARGGQSVSVKSTTRRSVQKSTTTRSIQKPTATRRSVQKSTTTRSVKKVTTRSVIRSSRPSSPMQSRFKTTPGAGRTRSKGVSFRSSSDRPVRSLKYSGMGGKTPREYISGRKYTLRRATPTKGTGRQSTSSIFKGRTSSRGKSSFRAPSTSRGTRSSGATFRSGSGRSVSRSAVRSSSRGRSGGRRR